MYTCYGVMCGRKRTEEINVRNCSSRTVITCILYTPRSQSFIILMCIGVSNYRRDAIILSTTVYNVLARPHEIHIYSFSTHNSSAHPIPYAIACAASTVVVITYNNAAAADNAHYTRREEPSERIIMNKKKK